MSLFQQSAKTVSGTVQEIAGSVGASSDPEMQGRAYTSLCASIQYFNSRANWDFLLMESAPSSVIGPFAVTGVTASAGQTSALMPAGHGFAVDDTISGLGLAVGARVSSTAAGNVGLNVAFDTTIGTGNVVITASGNRDLYTLPGDWKAAYSVKLLNAMSTLRPLRRRFYDRSTTTEFLTTTPVGYDIYQIAGKGKIRLLPMPVAADTLFLRYYRRMTVPTASGDGTALDIPQDYDEFLVAWAKWHFIVDKGEGRSEQGQTWITFAENGLKTMLSDQSRQPDEDLAFIPGAFQYNPAWGPNSTRGTFWDY